MKRFAQVLCTMVCMATLSIFTTSYIGGRQGDPLSVWLFPAEMFPILVAFLSVFILVILFFVALGRGREQCAVSLLSGCAMLFFISMFAFPPREVFQMGFRARIQSTITPDELRQIGIVVQSMLPEDGRLPGPQKNLWDEKEHGAQWQRLLKTTQIGKLDPWMVIVKSSDKVNLTWGGALAGHWGVVIETGQEQSPGDIAKGIRTFITSR